MSNTSCSFVSSELSTFKPSARKESAKVIGTHLVVRNHVCDDCKDGRILGELCQRVSPKPRNKIEDRA